MKRSAVLCALTFAVSVSPLLAGCDDAPPPPGSATGGGQQPAVSREDGGPGGQPLADGGATDPPPEVDDASTGPDREEPPDADAGGSGNDDAGPSPDGGMLDPQDAGPPPPIDAGPLDPPEQQGVWGESFQGPLAGFTSTATLVGSGDEVLLAIVSTTPHTPVQLVSGLGVQWTRRERQCSSRGSTGIEVWTAQSAAGSGPVSVNLAYDAASIALVVLRYRNVREVSPIGRSVSANTRGVDETCTSTNVDLDSTTYSLALSNLNVGAAVITAIAAPGTRHTPTTPLYELFETGIGDGGASLAVSDVVTTTFALSPGGTLENPVDWAAVAIEVKGP
ncbi:MAG: hypothetical protein ACO3JL_11370 [Myxococcota bacterium]